MQAHVANQGEVVVVHLSGRLDIEATVPFRNACMNFLMNKKVVFDFKDLSFVGSSGILPFLETMQDFATRTKQGFKFSSMGIEFRRVFAASTLAHVEVYETAQQAVAVLANPHVSEISSSPTAVAAQPVPLQQEGTVAGNYGLLSLRHEVEEGGQSVVAEDDEDSAEI